MEQNVAYHPRDFTLSRYFSIKLLKYLQIVMSRNQFTNCVLKEFTSNFPILFLG